jgi:tRNA threonylcarbamoyladenosine biosynthesis protein TsaB
MSSTPLRENRRVRTLVIETATAACSVALVEGDAPVASTHEVVGRGHAERLMPMIAELPKGGRADRILVDCGPGSFTGVRVGLAAALGLAIGWRVPVLGYSSLPAIACAAFASATDAAALMVIIDGGHGEVFVQTFDASPFAATMPLASMTPEDASAASAGWILVGSGVRHLVDPPTARDLGPALPQASAAIMLPAAFRSLDPRPIYGRAPDAKPMTSPGGLAT